MMKKLRHLTSTLLSAGWTKLSLYSFEMLRRDGTWQPQKREVYERPAAVAVLPYNDEKNTVLLVRQLRLAAHIAHGNMMQIEACAGLIDSGETPEQATLREAQEELGVTLFHLQKLFSGFASPGYSTEILHLYFADYDSAEKVAKGGGIIAEGEDIEVLELPFEEALSMLSQGEITDIKTAYLLNALGNHLFETKMKEAHF